MIILGEKERSPKLSYQPDHFDHVTLVVVLDYLKQQRLITGLSQTVKALDCLKQQRLNNKAKQFQLNTFGFS